MNTYTHFFWAVCIARWILFDRRRRPKGDRRRRPADDDDDDDNDNGGRGGLVVAATIHVPRFDLRGALLGSVLPDLPLIATTVVCIVRDWSSSSGGDDDDDDDYHHDYYDDRDDDYHHDYYYDDDCDGFYAENPHRKSWTYRLFESWYFTNPWVLTEHNLFHSPVSLAILLSLALLWHNLRHWCVGCSASPCCGSRFWYWALVSAFFHAVCDIPVHHDDGPLLLWPVDWSVRYESPVSYWDPDHYGIPVSIVEHVLDAIIVLWLLHLFCGHRRWWWWCRCRCRRRRSGGTTAATAAAATTIHGVSEEEEEAKMVPTTDPTTSGTCVATDREVEVTMTMTSIPDDDGRDNDDDDDHDGGVRDDIAAIDVV